MAEAQKSVLITGCSSGIGRATAELLQQQGYKVWATARRPESIADLKAAGCETLALDVTDEESMAAAVSAVVEADGAVDILINNAGYSQSGAVEDLEMAKIRRQFETNVFGLVRMCQLCLPGMRERKWGRIVNVSSMGGTLTFPGGGVYHASKYAVEALSDAMRFEVAGFGVKVILIQPGIIRTGFSKAAEANVDAAALGEGPYAGFNTAVVKATKEVYTDGMMARLGGDPPDVAHKIANVLAKSSPAARYPVTMSARVQMGLRRWMSDGLWDAFMRSVFPTPGA